jgi:flavin reductase (DIM6/NTAB) family NADH-FMN oxidoreductase RutF
VNILNDGQSEISTRFAKSLTEKWSGLDPDQGRVVDAPLIRDALASLECELWARYDGGDHVIMVGRIVHLQRTPSTSPQPLLFVQGRYRRVDREVAIETPFDVSHLLHGW